MAGLHEKLGLFGLAVATGGHRLKWHGLVEHHNEKEVQKVRSKTIHVCLGWVAQRSPGGECIAQDLIMRGVKRIEALYKDVFNSFL